MTGYQSSPSLFGLAPSLGTAYNQPPPSPEPQSFKAQVGQAAFGFGVAMQAGASIIDAIGQYGAVQAQKSDYRTRALDAKSQEYMAQLGASSARLVAGQIMQAGRQARRQLGLAAGQEQAARRTTQAARGLTNTGSSAEVRASMRYRQQAEELTIDTNTMRQRQASERQRVKMLNRATQARVDAANYMEMERALSPGLAAATSILQGMSSVAGSLANYYGRTS
jgi:hypothetical protein